MTWVARAIVLFREGEGRLPADLAELFRHRLPTGRSDDASKDLYGRPMDYAPAADGKGFALASLGKDGRPGGRGADADVRVREP